MRKRRSSLVKSLQARGFPMVLVGDTGDSESLACSDMDNVLAARLAMDELLAQGHRRIAFCRGRGDVHVTWQRQEGYRQALAAYGIPAGCEPLGPGGRRLRMDAGNPTSVNYPHINVGGLSLTRTPERFGGTLGRLTQQASLLFLRPVSISPEELTSKGD